MSVGSIGHIELRSVAGWAPGQVRLQILAEHSELRELLEEVQDLAKRVVTPEDEDSLKLAVRALVLLFGEHLHSEESVLVPLLMQVESWGPARAERLRDEHELQRALLRHVFETVGMRERAELCAAASAFAGWLLVDMDEEERDLLTPAIIGG